MENFLAIGKKNPPKKTFGGFFGRNFNFGGQNQGGSGAPRREGQIGAPNPGKQKIFLIFSKNPGAPWERLPVLFFFLISLIFVFSKWPNPKKVFFFSKQKKNLVYGESTLCRGGGP